VVVLTGHLLKDPLAAAASDGARSGGAPPDGTLPGAVTVEATRKALLDGLAGLADPGT
jgi:hypothetical protein